MVPFNQAIKFGVITGAALVAYSVVLYVADVNLFDTVFSILNGLFYFGLMIFIAVFAINKTRDLQLEKKITFLQAFLVGAVTLLIASYINSLFGFILNQYIDPDYMTRQVDNFIVDMEGKMPEDMLDSIVEKIEENADGTKNFIKGLWMSPIFAVVISSIISLFIKKDNSIQA